MLARKCDFCGGFYDHYTGYKCDSKNANSIMFVDRGLDNNHSESKIYDLCPSCISKILVLKKR